MAKKNTEIAAVILIFILMLIVAKIISEVYKHYGTDKNINQTVQKANESLKIIEDNYEDLLDLETSIKKQAVTWTGHLTFSTQLQNPHSSKALGISS